ncbi:hypothetical protein GUJ93_ZPchr0007g3435 [Zizania palustris]|uniref:Secreted protein n=1 Tax=Zizania palustris TaxID=103762 RepID=A0A8J5VYT6_ZIZPA|nr:hypothetical protein GUJ93_ZPchr0007g3435 [Zizania palustris]
MVRLGVQVMFDFRVLALLAVAGSLAGCLPADFPGLCLGCTLKRHSMHVYWTSCVRGVFIQGRWFSGSSRLSVCISISLACDSSSTMLLSSLSRCNPKSDGPKLVATNKT